ncbi:hypothetical protein JD844_013496 [Phrynosoma platyrhinos]|uniref:Tripartite motif-containing protein 39 n=1 Tax=Phrynosoma platyrhinos TaxID=52577 RepID=A0ABQ7TM01_PHRPL|nr:hypothetical protein JD844_013496 [Phrynosoma platyrhinos]
MHQFLEESQHLWMVRLEELLKEMEKRIERNITSISDWISRVSQLTTEIEEKCEQPANKFLQELAPMAAEDFVVEFCDETTCTICLECFKDPVTIDCGHNFCQACLNQYWEESDKEASCPQCREPVQQKQFKPNRQLANVANLVKKLQKLKTGEEEKEKDMCEKHRGLLKFFCMDDIAPVCVVCSKFTHRSHKVVPIEEAVQSYKLGFHEKL